MAKTVSFIGSFRKPDHYRIVKKAVKLFKKHGIRVLSPKGTNIFGSIEDFVIFDTDEKTYSPSEIQMITLDKILKSEAVFVCDLDGYVGRTTCYEIGFCLSRGVPLYFMEKPVDLPIPVAEDHIMRLETFLDIAMNNEETTMPFSPLCDAAQKSVSRIWPTNSEDNETATVNKSVVICGSMMFYNEMCECQRILQSNGINAIVPKDEDNIPDNISEEEFRVFKKRVSSAYLKKIRDKNTGAILVYNATKKGIANYIGANTFVEIAMAFAWNRNIYLFNGMYKPYEDELLAWDCKCLNGDLNTVINEATQKNEEIVDDYQQLTFFIDESQQLSFID